MIVEYVLTTETTVPDLATFRKRYPDAMIVKIDARRYFGQCRHCGTPIMSCDSYYSWPGGEFRACHAGPEMAITLTQDDIRAVAAEVVRQLTPVLGVERPEKDQGYVSAARRAEIAAQADRDMTALLLKQSRKKR